MRVMSYITRIKNCDNIYRENELKNDEIRGFLHMCLYMICEHRGLSQEEIAKRMMVNKSTITRWLALLEEKGYVLRRADENNRRITRVYPTQKTIDIQPEIRKIFSEWDDYLVAEFSDEEKEMLIKMLDVMLKRAMNRVMPE